MARVLLVEPDRLLAQTYRQALQTKSHEVMMCASAQSAIFGADASTPDVVILEFQLIAHSGIEFLYEFRSYPEWQDIPVIVLTNVPLQEFHDSWQLMRCDLGVGAYHYKPLTSLKTLLLSVDQCFAQPVV